jgi:hypothetical protein
VTRGATANLNMLTGTARENVALGIPPEFIDNSLAWRPLARDGIDAAVGENGDGIIRWSMPTPSHSPRTLQPTQVSGVG